MFSGALGVGTVGGRAGTALGSELLHSKKNETRSLTAPLSFAKLILLTYSFCKKRRKEAPAVMANRAGASPPEGTRQTWRVPPKFRRIASTSGGGNGYFVIPGFGS
jgi:hypothetical protein